MENSNLVYRVMVAGYEYNAYELAAMAGLSTDEISRILFHLEINRKVYSMVRGVIPRKRKYIKRSTIPIHRPCSPDILPHVSIQCQTVPSKKLHLVK